MAKGKLVSGKHVIARRYLVAGVVAGLALAGCSSSSKGSSSTIPTSGLPSTTVAKPTTRPTFTVIAHDYSFSVPNAVVPAGYVDVTLRNEGKQDHQLQIVKLGRSTFDQFKAAAIKTDIGAMKPTTVFVGGPNNVAPGKSVTATVKLEPGLYVVACFIPAADGKPHVAKGMLDEFQVAPSDTSINTAPKSSATIILGDFSFTVPAGFTGKGEVDISNQGTQVHEAALFKINPGKTLAQAKAFLLTPPGTPPPAGPPPFTEVTGTVGLTPLQHAYLNMNLTPGNYMLMCFFPDPKKANLPHAVEGMVKGFTIS
jgi:uncharacterized cupredoxin-like copper-binding protein